MSLGAEVFGDSGRWLDSMAISALSFTLVGSGWATAVLICMNRFRNNPLTLYSTHFQQGNVFQVWVSGCQLSAMTIASLLKGGCVLSHEHVEDGCESTCVKFGAENMTEQEICKFNPCIDYSKSDLHGKRIHSVMGRLS